jgi:hypothetical protein
MTISTETYIENDEIMKPSKGRPSWKNRRRVIFLTLFFCAFCILFIMIAGDDTRVNETIILGAFGLAFTTIGFYVAGAAWTDVNIEKIKVNRVDNDYSEQGPTFIPTLANGKGLEDK